jgi:hypothetical protein
MNSSKDTALNIDVLDLLLTSKMMPKGWKVENDTKRYSSYPLYQNDLGGGSITFRSNDSNVENFVVRFNSIKDASNNYSVHEIFHDSDGIFPIKWEGLDGIKFKSETITQYQIVCMISNKKTNGIIKSKTCGLESQYMNYMVVVLYNTTNVENSLSELETILTIVDQHVSSVINLNKLK